MLPLEVFEDAPEEPMGGLLEFIRTNVTGSRPLTQADLDRAIEWGNPLAYSRQFEVGPEVMFA